jgi:glyoxylase-like metal-dependent hydrolase (beta-lactamase superfamily II)
MSQAKNLPFPTPTAISGTMSDFPTGELIPLEPLVARVLAPNPSPYTFTGTQTHLVGTTDLAVIDPGPDDPAHLDALLAAIAGRPVIAILVTHTHRDHSPLSRALKAATGAPIVGCAPLALDPLGPRADAAFDRDYAPDRILAEGEQITGAGWTLTAIPTPGHTSNHLAFALEETRALFPGDTVMGWSTTVISPPDGDMADYLASLAKLMLRDDRVYYPAHGEAIATPRRFVRSLIGHRKQREGQILRLLARGVADLPTMVDQMYVGLDPRLVPAAQGSVLAHLVDLERRGRVEQEADAWTAI